MIDSPRQRRIAAQEAAAQNDVTKRHHVYAVILAVAMWGAIYLVLIGLGYEY